MGFETAHFRAQLRPPFGQTTFSGTLTPFRSAMVSIRQSEAIGGYTADMDFLLLAQEPQPATVIPVIELNGKALRLTDFTSLIAYWVRYALDTVRYDTEEAAQRLIDAGYATVIDDGPPRRIEMVTPLQVPRPIRLWLSAGATVAHDVQLPRALLASTRPAINLARESTCSRILGPRARAGVRPSRRRGRNDAC